MVQTGNRSQILIEAQQEFGEQREKQTDSEGEGNEIQVKKQGPARMIIKNPKGKKVKTNNFLD